MWLFRIETRKEYRDLLKQTENKFKGQVFKDKIDAQAALRQLPKGFEIVAFMRSGISI